MIKPPLLKYLILCKEASQNQDGSFNISGGFNVIPQLEPGEESRTEAFFLLLCVHLNDMATLYNVRVVLETPIGAEDIIAQFYMGNIYMGNGDYRLIDTVQRELFFKVPNTTGRFWYKVYINEQLIGITPLYVQQVVNQNILVPGILFTTPYM